MTKLYQLAWAAPVALMTWAWTYGPADALSITNRDSSEMAITVVEEEGKPGVTMKIEPSATLDGICTQGCVITLGNGESDTFEGEEFVSIEGGQFVISE